MSSQPAPLGAIVYSAGQSAVADAVLTGVARVLAGLNTRLAGAVQHNPSRPDRCRCDMVLEDLATGEAIAISEDRGPEAAELGGLRAARAGRPRVTGAGSRFSEFECAWFHQITPASPASHQSTSSG
jgi:Protein of unknown function (DUF2478)